MLEYSLMLLAMQLPKKENHVHLHYSSLDLDILMKLENITRGYVAKLLADSVFMATIYYLLHTINWQKQ